jgi:hypothetical protein
MVKSQLRRKPLFHEALWVRLGKLDEGPGPALLAVGLVPVDRLRAEVPLQETFVVQGIVSPMVAAGLPKEPGFRLYGPNSVEAPHPSELVLRVDGGLHKNEVAKV